MTTEASAPVPGERQDSEVDTRPELSSGMRIAVAVLAVLVAPLAFPAWGMERIIRRWRRNFEFGAFNSTPYFLFVAAIAAVGITAVDIGAIHIVAIYLLGLMELISLSVCATIAIASPGRLQALNRIVARRSFKVGVLTANRSTVYMAVISACYAVYFFGALTYVMWDADPSYFGNVSEPSTRLYSFWQFVQNSFLTITNAGSTLVSRRFLSQLIGDFERVVGIFLLVFLFSVLASGWAESALKRVSIGTAPKNDPDGSA